MRNLNLFIMKCISIYFVTLLLLMSGCESGRRIILKDLRCENLENPVAIDNTHPHFSWKIETDGQRLCRFWTVTRKSVVFWIMTVPGRTP